MSRKEDKIIAEFEAELKSGKKPRVKDYLKKHGKLDKDTIGTLFVLRALYDSRQEMRIPKSFHKEQMKLARDLIDGKPTDWYFKKYKPQPPEAEILEVPHPLTREKGGVPVVTLAAAGQAELYEMEAVMTENGWEKITRPYDLPHQDVFAVEVKGDSLEPVIPAGARVVIDPRKEVCTNDLALVITADYRSLVKKIRIKGDKVTLESSNPAYPPVEIDRKEIWRMYPVAWVKFK